MDSVSNRGFTNLQGIFGMDQREILDALPDGVLFADTAGNIYDVNRTFCEMVGWKRSGLIGVHISTLVDPDELKERPPRIDEFMRRGEIVSQRLFRRKDGTSFRGEIHSRLVNDGFSLTIVRDISHRQDDSSPSVINVRIHSDKAD